MKLLARTTIIFLLYAAVVAAGGTLVYYAIIHKLYYAYVDRTLTRRKLRVKQALRHELRTPADLAFWHRIDHNVEFAPLPAARADTARPDEFRDRMMYNTLTNQQQRYRQVAETVWFRGRPHRLEVRSSLLGTQDLLLGIVAAGVILLVLLVGGMLAIQHVLTRRYWRPFYHTLSVLQQYQLDQHHAPVLATTNIPEFKALNAALTKVLARHQRLYQRQREFAENAAHELQTPLAILRTKLDSLVQAPGLTEEQASHIEPLLAVTQRLTHLCRSLLLLVHLDQQLYFPTETVDLSASLRTLLEQLREQLEASQLTLQCALEPRVIVSGNRSLLEILVSNLVVNAIRHNLPGGFVTVTLTPQQLTVENSGRPQALPADQLFARFRPNPGRPPGSVGLGLPIARQICETSGFLLTYHYEVPGRHVLRVRIR
ncbi:MAG: sensor histidine kinase [Janthinobacterium lividum]